MGIQHNSHFLTLLLKQKENHMSTLKNEIKTSKEFGYDIKLSLTLNIISKINWNNDCNIISAKLNNI